MTEQLNDAGFKFDDCFSGGGDEERRKKSRVVVF